MFRSTLRDDKNATCSFRERPHGLYLKDFSGDFYGDCFDVVMRLYECKFMEAMVQVATDFGIIDGTPAIRKEIPIRDVSKQKKDFQVIRREWTLGDKEFWSQFHITRKDLKRFSVTPVETLWVDDKVQYRYDPSDPAYAYYFGNGDYKIYFPYRKKYRFLSNGPHLQGWREMDLTSKSVIITKSLKDVIVLYKMGFTAIAPPAEGAYIDPNTIEFLVNYDTTILFDNDKAGITWARNNSLKYHLPYFWYNTDEIKDTSDLVKLAGLEEAKQVILDYLKKRNYVIKEKNCNIFECEWKKSGIRELNSHDLGTA